MGTGSDGNSWARRRRRAPQSSGGKPETASGGVEAMESGAGQKTPSGRRGSGGGRERENAGVGRRKETWDEEKYIFIYI